MTHTNDGVDIEQGQSLYTCAGKMANRPLLVSYQVPVGKFWITLLNGSNVFQVPASALFSTSLAAAKGRLKWLNREIQQAKGRIEYEGVSRCIVEKHHLEKILDWIDKSW